MTEKELLQLPHITLNDAAKFLQYEYCAQQLRELSKLGRCFFCTAEKKPGSSRYTYHINTGRLLQCKAGADVITN